MNNIRYIVAVFLLLTMVTAKAQEDVEYRMELGAGLNMTAYQGDCSDALFGNMQPGGSIIFRAILNPRSALRISGMLTKVKGDVANSNTIYPDLTPQKYSFSNTLGDLSVMYEYNFWPYGTGKEYRGAKRCTPFVAVGLGLTYVSTKDGTYDFSSGNYEGGEYIPNHSGTKGVVAGNLPIGIGVKYKLGARTNISFDWIMHLAFTDYIDSVKDPYRIQSSGLLKNLDTYSTLSLSLTYSLSPKCSTCHNSDWHY